jgi:hypothetical protein
MELVLHDASLLAWSTNKKRKRNDAYIKQIKTERPDEDIKELDWQEIRYGAKSRD